LSEWFNENWTCDWLTRHNIQHRTAFVTVREKKFVRSSPDNVLIQTEWDTFFLCSIRNREGSTAEMFFFGESCGVLWEKMCSSVIVLCLLRSLFICVRTQMWRLWMLSCDFFFLFFYGKVSRETHFSFWIFFWNVKKLLAELNWWNMNLTFFCESHTHATVILNVWM